METDNSERLKPDFRDRFHDCQPSTGNDRQKKGKIQLVQKDGRHPPQRFWAWWPRACVCVSSSYLSPVYHLSVYHLSVICLSSMYLSPVCVELCRTKDLAMRNVLRRSSDGVVERERALGVTLDTRTFRQVTRQVGGGAKT